MSRQLVESANAAIQALGEALVQALKDKAELEARLAALTGAARRICIECGPLSCAPHPESLLALAQLLPGAALEKGEA